MNVTVELLVEGDSEESYCGNSGALNAYYASSGVYFLPRKHQTGWNKQENKPAKGGILSWTKFTQELTAIVLAAYRRNNKSPEIGKVLVSTMFDLYGLEHEAHGLDYRAITHNCKTGVQKAAAIETHLLNEIVRKTQLDIQTLQSFFIPYCVSHEFEAILFCKLETLKLYFSDEEHSRLIDKLEQETSNKEPEDINDSPQTAPSKRIIQAIPNYERLKGILGGDFASAIDLNHVRTKMPGFHNWLCRVEELSGLTP